MSAGLTCSPWWCIEKIKGKRSTPTFTPSKPVHFPDCWVAHMKGTLVAGQRADSAAGYCPSKTLSYSENIMIHLYIFSSQPYTHSHHTQTCAHIDTRTPTHTHTHSHPRCQMFWNISVGAQSNKKKNVICTSSAAHQPTGKAVGSILWLIWNRLTRGDFLPSFGQPFLLTSLGTESFCCSKTKQMFQPKCPLSVSLVSIRGGNKKRLSISQELLEVHLVGGWGFYTHTSLNCLTGEDSLLTYIVSLAPRFDMTACQHWL